MTQLLADTPRARASDPSTSHQAAAKVKESGKLNREQREVLSWIQRYPGHTTGELGRLMAIEKHGDWRFWNDERITVNKRASELRPVHVRNGESRPCEVTGNSMQTWYAV